MPGSTNKTPGVYINEINAFPNSVVAVATAVPAFIGYTPQALYEGKSYTNVVCKVSSFSEFSAIYCLPDPPPPASPTRQYSPHYYPMAQKSQPVNQAFLESNGTYYALLPDLYTIYYLYNSIKLFYQNGGGDAYIVSVGTYGPPSGKPMEPGSPIMNPNVHLNDLVNGLKLLRNEQEPTLYICPEATLLSVDDNGTLMQEMLQQSATMMTAVSVFDIIGGRNPDPILYTRDIAVFREKTGTQGLSYGTAYYPFVGTTIMQQEDIDYTNLFGGEVRQLLPILSPPTHPDPVTATLLSNIANAPNALTVSQYNNALLIASKTYSQLIHLILTDANLLPPSGAMAGLITTCDNLNGVWEAPANVSPVGVSSLPIHLSDTQQANLTIDGVSGKSINAIRFFNGMGILVWGARTLDGNSPDWRYLSVRRTATFLKQSCKLAAQAYVFQPNEQKTWEAVKSMINSFLTSIWKQGGLVGATPSDAFSVDCRLGTTMTGEAILNDFMIVTVKVALVHPAEFIVFTFRQQMAVPD